MDVQLLYPIWHSDLDLARQELDSWEDLLNSVNQDVEPSPATRDETWKKELNRIQYFRQLINQLENKIRILEQQTANKRVKKSLERDLRLSQQSFQKGMDSFHTEYRGFKTEIRGYLTAQKTF